MAIKFAAALSASLPTVPFPKTASVGARMTKGAAICQEFSDEVSVGTTVLEPHPLRLFESREEIKCRVDINFFTPLVERMVQGGYCCTQVQKDLEGNTCTTWFEPMSRDS